MSRKKIINPKVILNGREFESVEVLESLVPNINSNQRLSKAISTFNTIDINIIIRDHFAHSDTQCLIECLMNCMRVPVSHYLFVSRLAEQHDLLKTMLLLGCAFESREKQRRYFYQGFAYATIHSLVEANDFRVSAKTLRQYCNLENTRVIDKVINRFRYVYDGRPYTQLRDIYDDLNVKAPFKLFQQYFMSCRNIDQARANAELMHESQHTVEKRKTWNEISSSFQSTLFDVAKLSTADVVTLNTQLKRKESYLLEKDDCEGECDLVKK